MEHIGHGVSIARHIINRTAVSKQKRNVFLGLEFFVTSIFLKKTPVMMVVWSLA